MGEKNTGNQFIIDDVTREITVDLGADGVTGLVNKESDETIKGFKEFQEDIKIGENNEIQGSLYIVANNLSSTTKLAANSSGPNRTLFLPDKDGTIATTDDIPSVTTPTLQEVTDEGNETSKTLTIYGTNSAAVRFANADKNNILFVGTDESAFGVNNNDAVAYMYGSGKFHVATSSQRRLTVDSSGNVGIGTISPTEKLEVGGNIKAENAFLDGNLEVNGASTLNGNTTVNGDADVTGNLDVGTSATVGGQISVGDAPTDPTHVVRLEDTFVIDPSVAVPASSVLATAYVDKPAGCRIFFQNVNIMVTKISVSVFVQHVVTVV